MQTQKNGLRQIGRHATIWSLLCSSQNEKRSSMARKDLVKCDDKTRAQNETTCVTVWQFACCIMSTNVILTLWNHVILWSCSSRKKKSSEVRSWRCAEAKSCELTCHTSLKPKQATHHRYHCWQKEFKFCIFIRFRTDKSALKPTPCSDFRPHNLTCVYSHGRSPVWQGLTTVSHVPPQQPWMCVESWKKSSVRSPYPKPLPMSHVPPQQPQMCVESWKNSSVRSPYPKPLPMSHVPPQQP